MSAEARLREAVTVAGYWPPSMLILALRVRGGLAYVDGAAAVRLTCRRDDVFAFVEEFVGRKRAWPTVGDAAPLRSVVEIIGCRVSRRGRSRSGCRHERQPR